MHYYVRMLLGKKILEWSKTPEEALDRMIRITNRWALDGPSEFRQRLLLDARALRPALPERERSSASFVT
jgi:hypothetical protein